MAEARIHPLTPSVPEPTETAALWRERLGKTLRAVRESRQARLVDVAERAGISPQYLSEIERGRKEPSSEMIAAVVGALGVDLDHVLADVLERAGRRVRPASRVASLRRPGRTRAAGRFEIGQKQTPTLRAISPSAGPVLMAA